MARVYSEQFHEFLETYGELLDQAEGLEDELEGLQEEISDRLDDLYDSLRETLKQLHALDSQIWQFRCCEVLTEPVVKEQVQETDKPALLSTLDPADETDPFADICKA